MNKLPESAPGLLRKASSDLEAADLLFKHGMLDVACFHAQQCAEKSLKALCACKDESYPFTHTLAELCHQAMSHLPTLAPMRERLAALTPFAVFVRYGEEIDVAPNDAKEALQTAHEVYDLIFKIVHTASP